MAKMMMWTALVVGLLFIGLNCFGQMSNNNFKEEFKQHMLTPTEKPKLNFEHRDVIHTNVAGGILATISIPVVVASTITLVKGGDNTNMAVTGLFFGGLGLGGSITLHSLGIKKAVKYGKAGKLFPDLEK